LKKPTNEDELKKYKAHLVKKLRLDEFGDLLADHCSEGYLELAEIAFIFQHLDSYRFLITDMLTTGRQKEKLHEIHARNMALSKECLDLINQDAEAFINDGPGREENRERNKTDSQAGRLSIVEDEHRSGDNSKKQKENYS
jgi:hypothetical protein